jgi:hypothetical protein
MTRKASAKKSTAARTTLTQWLSALTGAGLVALVTFFYQRCTPSKTLFVIERADVHAVYVLVSNTAPRNPSQLVEPRLDFGNFPLENATLEPMVGDENKMVIDPGHVTIGLTPRGLGTKMKPGTSEPYTREEILSMLEVQNPQMTLWIEVEESNGTQRKLHQPMPVRLIKELIAEKLTDRGT